VRNPERRKRLASSLNGEESKIKIENHRKRIEKVMPYLNDEQKIHAQDDLDHITDITS
jgi:hypothetical protein